MDDTRRRMIEIGAKLLRKQGFHATTLIQIVEEGKLPRGSIYHHFPGGKTQLALEAIRRAAEDVAADLASVAARAHGASEAVALYFELMADRLEASGYLEGCWYAATALEVAPTNPELTQALSEQFTRWQTMVAMALTAWGVPAERADASAALLITSLEGAILVARVHRDTRVLRGLIPMLQASVTANA